MPIRAPMLTNTLPLHATTGPTRRRLYRLRFAVQPSATAARARRHRARPAAPRAPGNAARARRCRARPAGPRAHGGAAPRSSDDATASSWGFSAPANASRRSNAFTVLAPRLLTKARRGSHRQPKINYQQRNNNQSRMLQSIAWCLFRRHYQ